MKLRLSSRAGRTMASWFAGATLALIAPLAWAVPPSLTGTPLTVPFPGLNSSVIVNLRQQGVISGSPSIQTGSGGIIYILEGESQTPLDGLNVYGIGGQAFGNVCWQITNNGRSETELPPGPYFSDISARNLRFESANGTIVVVNGAGPTVNVNDPAQLAACYDPNESPVANAGVDRTVAAGESVTLAGSASDADGALLTYEWFRQDGENGETAIATGPTPTVTLQDGVNQLRLVATDEGGATGSDTVTITVQATSAPTANAGEDRTIVDTNGAAGESVTLAGSATVTEGGQLTYEWFLVDAENGENGETAFATGPTPTVTLPDGVNQLRLVVTDEGGNTDSDTVTITVQAASGPTANAGADRTIADTDSDEGEDVLLDGSLSTDSDGAIVDYRWSRVIEGETEEILGNGAGATLQVRLPDGDNTIRLLITDNTGNQASDTALITVGANVVTTLSEIPNLSPNQRRVAQALDRVCGQLRDLSGGEGAALTADQQNLLVRCDGLQTGNTTGNQVAALDEIVADDFAVARTQTLLFANTQYAGVTDRLMALRGGARGLSLAGLNIIVDGKSVPLAQLQDMVKGLLGGGASADEPGGLLSDKWGMWARGNYSVGEKDRNSSSPSFDADQWALVGGVDYRFSDKVVGGVSLAYGQSSIDFELGAGGLDTDTWAISLYGSAYAAKNFYFDAIVNVANAEYGADRNITYVDGSGLIDVDARGTTDGMTYSTGLSGGYDFLVGGLTLSPNLGFFYIDATIDSFAERGASGLNLLYDEQTFQSFTGNLGIRATYAWNQRWGVLLPHVRVDYVREFKTDADVFGVRFAADPNATSAPPILVETDNPDESYWRLATGLSAQFVHGISAYVEYQRLESFEFISFQDVSFGLRLQRSF